MKKGMLFLGLISTAAIDVMANNSDVVCCKDPHEAELCLNIDQSLKEEKGLQDTLSLFNSPSYQFFKLCQKEGDCPSVLCEKAEKLIAQGADPNFAYNNLSLIRLASVNGKEEIVKLLLECGAMPTVEDVNAVSIKIYVLATCKEDEMLSQDDPYPGISFEHDKEKFLSIRERLSAAIGITFDSCFEVRR